MSVSTTIERLSNVSAIVRPQEPADVDAVRDLLTRAFVREPNVVALEATLETRTDSFGFVAEHDGGVVGHVRLTRGWIDAERRLVEVLVLSPLSVAPERQRQGIGRRLCAYAVERAEALRAPAVFLEGSPRYYSRLGWRPATELGVTPPSVRIPPAAFQAVGLPGWEAWMSGALVYPEPFWSHDCVGLRGAALADARRPTG
jgi:putative acetyltransferase